MSLGTPVLIGRLKIRGGFEFRAADGSVIKQVEIIDGSLPVVAAQPSAEQTAPELPHGPDPA